MASKSKQVSRRIYKCGECGTRRTVSIVELNRSARPKCMGCGFWILRRISPDAGSATSGFDALTRYVASTLVYGFDGWSVPVPYST